MHKKILSICCCLLTAVLLFGCGGSQQSLSGSASDIADALKDGGTFEEELNALDENMLSRVYNVSEDTLSDWKVYIGSGATAEEIAVFIAKDEQSAQAVLSAVEERLSDRKDSYRDYVPKELPKLEDAVVLQEGNYVVFCVSGDSEQAKECLEQFRNS